MNTKDFIRLGVPLGEATQRATDFIRKFILAGGDKTRLEEELKAIIATPSTFADDSLRSELAKALLNAPPPPRTEPIKYRQWGEGLEHEAVVQMEKPACCRWRWLAPSCRMLTLVTVCPSAGYWQPRTRLFRMRSAWISPAA